METLLLLLLLLFTLSVPLYECAANPNCTTETACSCIFANGDGINLVGYKSANGSSYMESTQSVDGNVYRFYPCGADKPWTDNGDCKTVDTACQYSTQEDIYYSIGKTSMYTIKEAISDNEHSYVTFVYTGGSSADAGQRESSIKVTCDNTESLTFLGEDPQLEYNLEFKTPKGCPPSGNAPVLFILVLLVLFIAAVTYLSVGIMLMVLWKGARGLEIVPNLGFWKDFPFLLKDGFLFCFSCIPAVRSRIGGEKPYSALK